MTNGAVALLRKRWTSLRAWVAAMDYSAADYTNDRIGGLEREVEQLKDELRRTRTNYRSVPVGQHIEISHPRQQGIWRRVQSSCASDGDPGPAHVVPLTLAKWIC
jgi:hypothetical protein